MGFAAPSGRASAGAASPARTSVVARLTMPGAPDQVKQARGLVLRALGGVHPRLDDAVLMTSELVTNAIVHSNSHEPGGTVIVTILESSGGVRVEVADSGSDVTAPVVRTNVYAADGHGLFLVQNLADQWGYLRDESGTTVWFWLSCG